MVTFPEFYIGGNVGSGHSQPHDVNRVRNLLDETGYGSAPPVPSGRYDQSTQDYISGFQDDFGLKKDGFMAPGGPTELAMTLALDAKRAGGKEGLDAFREPFAEMNRDGFKYMPDSYSRWERPRGWVDPTGEKMTDTQRDDAIFSKAVGNRIKRIPFNDPTPHMNRPNPIAPLAKSVFGERILASAPRPTPPKATPVSRTTPMEATPKPALAQTQIAQATPAKPNSAQSQAKQTTTSNWALPGSTKPGSINNPDRDPLPNSKVSQQWRIALHGRESKDKNYQANYGKGAALGRYQFTLIGLQDIGMKDKNGKWTGKHGIRSNQQFLDNALIQEKALVEYLDRVNVQLHGNNSMLLAGQKFQGKIAAITITEDGLMAAGHRYGAKSVRRYLAHLKNNGWVSDESGFPPKLKNNFLAVETRLRLFENIPWRSKVNNP